jgi:hypothetical protein
VCTGVSFFLFLSELDAPKSDIIWVFPTYLGFSLLGVIETCATSRMLDLFFFCCDGVSRHSFQLSNMVMNSSSFKKLPYTCIFMFMSLDDCVLGWQLAYRVTLVTVRNKFYQIHHFRLILGCYHWYIWQFEKKRFVSGHRKTSWFFGPGSKLFSRENHRHCGFLLKWSTWYIQLWLNSTFLHISTPHSHLHCQFRLPNPLTAMEYENNMITRLKLHEVPMNWKLGTIN